MDTASLVADALAHPTSGFAAIYDAYADRLHDYCHSILRNADDAADATQDCFVVAYQRLGQLRDPDKLTAWLYAIARSRCLRRIEQRRRQLPVDDMERLTPAEDDPTPLGAAEARHLVWAAAAGLADDDRAVLDAHLRHGLTGPELADVLGVSTTKANHMLHRMKQRLERTLGAVVVLRAGRSDCEELASLAGDGDLTPLIRKRVARHIEGCDVCAETRRRFAPDVLYSAVPVLAAPVSLRARVLDHLSVGTSGIDGIEWRDDGFPSERARQDPDESPTDSSGGTGSASMASRSRVLIGAAVAATSLLLGALWASGGLRNDSPLDVAVSSATTLTAPASSTEPPETVGEATIVAPASTVAPTTAAKATTSAPAAVVTTTSTAGVDRIPPTLGPLELTCGSPIVARTTVLDDTDPSPSATLVLTWSGHSNAEIPMTRVDGSNEYEALISRGPLGEGTTTFTASGTVRDAAGNTARRSVSESCTIIN